MRGLVLAIGALVMVVGCGRLPGVQNSAGDFKLYEASATSGSQQVSVIDSRSHAVERTLPLGTPSPDWSHLYTVQGSNLIDLDPQTGAVLNQIRLPGAYQLPPATMSGVPGGLSPDGRWLVLETFDRSSSSSVRATHLIVVDTSYARKPQRIDLTGYFQFDAVNNEGTRVYLIEYVSDSQYYVRFFNVGSGALDPTIVFDKSDGSAAMAGTRLSGIASRDGQWLYSVYVRPDKSAFIHALSLEDPIAFCIDLPGSGYSTNPDEVGWSLALNAPGTNLFAANGATGTVVEIFIDNGFPSTNRVAHLATGQASSALVQDVQAKELGGNAAAVSPDGRTLVIAGKTGLVWIDTASMTARARQLADWSVWSLGMSPDGSTVYAVNDAGMIAELPMAGAHSPTTFSGAAGQPLALIRVAAA